MKPGDLQSPPSIYKQLAKKSGVKSGEESNALFTLPKQLIHKYLRHSGEGWRVFLKVADNRYKLQRIANPLGRLTEDSHLTHCKFVGTPHGRKEDLK